MNCQCDLEMSIKQIFKTATSNSIEIKRAIGVVERPEGQARGWSYWGGVSDPFPSARGSGGAGEAL